jgi:uncharacterized delta-60 repeat protein
VRLREPALAVCLLLAAAAPAAARQHEPVRLWSISEVRQGTGAQQLAGGGQIGGRLRKTLDLGPAAFNFRESPLDGRAAGEVFSSADGKSYSVLAQAPSFNPFRPRSPKGGLAHLEELQAYEKGARDASLKVTIDKARIETIDANLGLSRQECATQLCRPVRGRVKFHVRAYAASAGGDFYDVGGVAFIEGHTDHWGVDAVTTSDSQRRLWDLEDWFRVSAIDGTFVQMQLDRLPLRVPLRSVREGELFAVDVTLDAQAVDDRGRESGVHVILDDPQEAGPPLLTTHGLKPRGRPRFKAPRRRPLPAARCRAGRRKGGTLQLSAPAFPADEGSGAPMVLVTRTGKPRGPVSAVVSTRGGSARAGRDFTRTKTRVRFDAGDRSPRLVEIPIREDGAVEPPESLSVTLDHARCAKRGRHRATVTILDDDGAAAPPPVPQFTIGGTVDGLAGSGLVLDDLGTRLSVAANGRFTFPGTRAQGLGYDVRVAADPHDPDQRCSVERGAGTVTGDVSDVAIHCVTPAPPAGLDPTFGSDGRVSTAIGGEAEGEAVVIQPDGRIVTAGRRSTGAGVDFALTRHDDRGRLDPGFGSVGVATTDLGTADDQALDAAPLPGGGVVAVGRTLTGGGDFALVRYRPDGSPDPGFGTAGVVTTDLLGGGDQANAVAVQPDGKIVVGGFAAHGVLSDGDFALVRYDADGTRDESFGDHGIVTTDLGTRSDDVRALAIQPDGRIVAAGSAGEDVALARYLADGTLDTSFGQDGSRISDFGSDDVANGVALTPDGHVLVAGFTLGPGADRDFALARYTAGGDLDTAFGGDGLVTTDVGGGDDFAEGLLVDASGRIVLVGRATSATILDMALVRYRADGALDRGFDGDGILTADFHGKGEFGQDVALDARGRIVAAGYTGTSGGTEFALLRANP